jgi:hypothetical protein
MKKIVIICQGRTGSTNLSDFYKKKYKIKNMGEVFRNLNYVKDSEYLINELNKKPNWIVKLVPLQVLRSAFVSFINKKYSQLSFNNKMRVFQHIEHFKNNGTNYSYYIENKEEILQEAIDICVKIIKVSDHHCYLYRRDFIGQIKSLVSASIVKEYGPNRKKEKVYVPTEKIATTSNNIIDTYELIQRLYAIIPGELIETESMRVGKKYNQITVYGNFDTINNYDIEREVFHLY